MLYTRNAKSPRTCSHGYCRGHLFWVGKILKRGGCGEGPRRAQRKARKRPSPSLLDEKVQKLSEPVSMSVWRASTGGTGFIAETLVLNHRGHRGSLRDAIHQGTRNRRGRAASGISEAISFG